jgi:RNA polymerase sigma factor (sigma-70 family)
MLRAHANSILRHVRRLAAGNEAAPTDRDLLQAYLEHQDGAAFAALVDRHGPMVLGVCQAVLRHRHDAEDAFQATFLVLARNAGSIRRRDGLASWLHGVAYRVALKAQARRARQHALAATVPAPGPVAPADDLSWGEVRTLLHTELAALPECFRAPLVLCYLEGLTQDEAARRLGWTTATLKGRLQRGRDRLRRRLKRRGLAPAALGATALAGQALAAPLPSPLAEATVRTVLSGTGETVSAAAAALAHGVWKPLVPAKHWVLAAVLLAGASLAGGAALFPQKPADSEPAAAAPPAPNQVAPRADRFGDPLPDGAVARLGTVRFNHGDSLNGLYFTPDGQTIISEGGGFLHLWDAATGKDLRRFATVKPSFDDQTVLSPDGKMMTFLNQENDHDTVRVWDLAQEKEVRTVPLPVQRNMSSIVIRNALAPDGRLGAVHTTKAIRVFDLTTARELYQIPHGEEVQFGQLRDHVLAVVFAGSDQLVIADNKSQVIAVRDGRTGKLIRQFAHGAPVQVLAASPDGRRLATLEHHTYAIHRFLDKDVVHVWDLTTGTQTHALAARPKRWFMNVRFSPDGKLLVASSAGHDGHEVTVWDAATGRQVREFSRASGGAIAFSPDGSRLAEGAMGKFNLWDLKTGRCLSSGDSEHTLAAKVFLSPAGDRALTSGCFSISTWDGTTGRRLHSFDLPLFFASDPDRNFSPDGRYALSFTGDFEKLQILVWEVAAGRLLHTLQPPNASGQVKTAFSPDSTRLALWIPGKETVIRFWDVRTGKEVRSFPETRAGWPGRLFFTPDGNTLIVAGRRIVGFDVASGKELFAWRPEPSTSNSRKTDAADRAGDEEGRIAWRALAVSPDGATVAWIRYGEVFGREKMEDRIVLCEARTGRLIRRWNDSGKPSRYFEQLVYSPDGRLVASSDGEVVHLWEVATGKEVRTFRGHRGEISSLAFSANGRRLISAGTDSTGLIWDLPLAVGARAPLPKGAGDNEIAAWWADLAGADARQAYAAVWRLAEAPVASVSFLRQHLRPVTDAEVKEIRQHLKDLDAEAFAVREKAFQQLERLGPAAAADLRQALEKKPSLEARRRIERLLENLDHRPLAGEPLRIVRALAVLEYTGTAEARRLLRELAAGAPGAWSTHEAKAALERLASGKTP